jgi:YesN/AraC family two-component response regulator
MPEMNGFELVREAKHLNPDIKTVIMTAFEINESEFSKVMPSTKVDDFVRKPVSVNLLKTVLLKHIDNTNMLLGR